MTARTELRWLDAQPDVVAQDRPLQLLQRGTGIEPRLLSQDGPRAAVHRERVRLPAAAVERQHELSLQLLAKRPLPYERLELRNQLVVPTEGEVRLDPFLERNRPQLLEA